ncbi:MAG: hypothetical protein ACM3OA_06900 [Acidobacteriota bacterium]
MGEPKLTEARDLLLERVADAMPGARNMPYRRRQAECAVDAMLSFDGLQALAEQWLDEHYPADVKLVCDPDSPDPGPRLAAALRDCLEARS